MELVKVTIDLAFKKIFGVEGSEDILIDFLESILHVEIGEIEVQHDPHVHGDLVDEKEIIMDIKAMIK